MFAEALKTCEPKQTVLFDLSGIPMTQSEVTGLTALFIGPEGGWTEKEVTEAKERGCFIGSLGKLTLRGETAGIVGTYRVVYSI